MCIHTAEHGGECVYHCEPPSDKRYHTHSGPFPVLYVTAAGHDEKPSCEHGPFINFPGRHLISPPSPPLEAVGKKILDIAALHRKSMLLSRMLEAPPGHEGRESSLKCWTGFAAAGLLFDFLQRQEM